MAEVADVAPESAPESNIPMARDSGRRWTARAVLVDPDGGPAEHLRHFAMRLNRDLDSRGERSVAVTSSLRGEGKTTVACNLALALTAVTENKRIALVDLDLRRPRAASALGVEPAVGIERVLSGAAPLEAARIRTQVPALDLYLVRRPVAGLFGATAAGRVIAELGSKYDLVVVDTPPVLLVPDVVLLLPHVGACFVVVRLGVTRQNALAKALEEIPEDKLLGAFVNEMRRPSYYGDYGYYSDA